MRFAYDLTGASPHIKKYQINATLSYAGIPVLKGGSNTKGIVACSTTAAVGVVGITMDTATVVTAQQTDNSDTARLVSVIINPHAVYKARLSGGATENTALATPIVTTAATDGLSVTTAATDWSSPETDEGVVFGYYGANAGTGRKITSTSSTAATVLVAFPVDTAVGDTFLRIPFCASPYGYETQYPQLTTNLFQVDASVAVDTDNVNFRIVELELRDAGQQGTTNSFAYLITNGSVWSAGLAV